MDPNESFVLTLLIGGATLVGSVAIIGGFLHHRRERVLTHAERMKALELGRPMPDDAATARIKAALGISSDPETAASQGLAGKCYSTAFWVAFWGFIAAAGGAGANTEVAMAIAVSVGAIGVTAVICGAILAARVPVTAAPGFARKPMIEEDAFDVVSSRG